MTQSINFSQFFPEKNKKHKIKPSKTPQHYEFLNGNIKTMRFGNKSPVSFADILPSSQTW